MVSRRTVEAQATNGTVPTAPLGTEAERTAIRGHLERVLSHSVFRNSKRYSAVLRYIVEQTVDGTGAQLKERTIGIEVFGRVPDYDTANDHVVRSAIAEIRKRLAQYYGEDGRDNELRIDVQPGSYVPHFRWVHERPCTMATQTNLGPENTITPLAPSSLLTQHRPLLRWSAYFGVVVMVLSVVLVNWATPKGPLQTFWAPVFSSQAPVLLCVGTLQGGRESTGGHPDATPPVTMMEFHSSDSQMVHVYDAITFARLAGLLQANRKQYRPTSQSEANFADLQNGPAVLIGLMNNDWTERLVSDLRFTIERQSALPVLTIRDRNNPSNRAWSMDYSAPYMNVTKDYALVLRLTDPKTEQIVVVAAGISVFGTVAAGELLTDGNEMRKLSAVAPKGWETKNMEIVLSTEVIRGKPGHATIVASQFW